MNLNIAIFFRVHAPIDIHWGLSSLFPRFLVQIMFEFSMKCHHLLFTRVNNNFYACGICFFSPFSLSYSGIQQQSCMLHKIGCLTWRTERCREVHWAGPYLCKGIHQERSNSILHERIWQSPGDLSGGVETWLKQPGTGWWCPTVIDLFDMKSKISFLISCLTCWVYLTTHFHRCIEQINRTNRGDLSPEELKERQVSLF